MKQQKQRWSMKKICCASFVIYFLLIIAFYFLAGDQLHYRNSRGNMEMPAADAGTVELAQGAVVEQIFAPQIQRLESVSVLWGTYYRANIGTITMQLVDTRDGAILMENHIDAATLAEGTATEMAAETPIETVYNAPLILRITADSPVGQAASPLMNSGESLENGQLYLNGQPANGVLCFGVSGEDYIWTGLHYWEFTAIGAALLALVWILFYVRLRRNKHSYIANALEAVRKYRFLIRQLVGRDFKTKYKRSILGVFWSFLNPLLMMLVQYFVFSNLFRFEVSFYPAYILTGIVCFNFFSESCGMTLGAVLGNAGLITKVYMPKYIYPLSRTLSSGVNLLISLIPLLIVCLVSGVRFEKSIVLSVFFLLCLFVFTLGLGMLLSASMVFFRDTQFLWGVFSMMWMYATPIFYPESILPDHFKFVLTINPLYYFIKNIRMCVIGGISPEPIVYAQCFLIAFVMLIIGSFVFKKTQDKFVLYL